MTTTREKFRARRAARNPWKYMTDNQRLDSIRSLADKAIRRPAEFGPLTDEQREVWGKPALWHGK
ncbi:MAG: hypothetical protein IPM01_29535 [Burkholderiaceae bacterium]|nr:hypothetical protein [Burkholderiaceae bacterium]